MISYYDLAGPRDAPVVVLSHSVGADRTMWDEQVTVLAARFRVLRYDLRGHGYTPAPPGPYDLEQLGTDTLELLDLLGIHRFHFAGTSLGGMIGMWLGQQAPERVDRLALLCTSVDFGPGTSWTERAALARRDGTSAFVESTLDRWFTSAFVARADVVTKYGGMLTACHDEGYAGCCEAIASMDLLPGLADISAPALVIAGRDDPATPPPHAERIVGTLPNARLEVVDGAAHLANVERSEVVNPLLLDHFAAEQPGI